jgi:putative inorganic carbon (HCO3(-)) transporter
MTAPPTLSVGTTEHAAAQHARLELPRRGAWLAGFLAAEPLILLGLAPFIWFPRAWSGWLLLIIPLLWALRWRATGRLLARTPYDIPVACLLACLPLTAVAIIDWAAAAPRYHTFLLGLALLYALANALSTEAWVIRGALAAIVLMGGGVASLGLVGTDWLTNNVLPLEPLSAQLRRLVRGVANATPHGAADPNEIGGALTLLLPLALSALLGLARGPGRKGWWALMLGVGAAVGALMAGVLILTQSCSAYSGTAIGVMLVLGSWVATLRTSTRFRTAGFGLLGLGAGVMGWGIWRMVVSWPGGVDSLSITLPVRAELWNRGLSMLQDFPFTGVGMGQFSLVLHALYTPFLIPPDYWVAHAHNVFLQLALDLGIPGAAAMAFVIGAFLREMWRAARRSADPVPQAIAVGLGAGMLAFLVYGLTDAISIGARGSIVLWVVLGIGAALARVSGGRSRVEREPCPRTSARTT